MDWWRRLLQRKPNGPAPAVKEAEEVRDSQFGEWENTMREVERVQAIAKGEPRPPRRVHP